MLYSDGFRKIARDGLSGRWATAVGTGLVAGLFGVTRVNNSSTFRYVLDRGDDRGLSRLAYENLGAILQSLMGLLIIILIWSVICFVVGGAVTLGYAKFNLELVAKDRRDVYFSDLFSQFSRIEEGFVMKVSRGRG